MDTSVLDLKLDALTSFPRLQAETVRRFVEALRDLDDEELLNINPIRFAAQRGFSEAEATELFIHGAKVGLFDFVWNLICPSCGALITSHDSLNSIEAVNHCALCDVEVASNLDDQVEVAFVLNPTVGRVEVDPYVDMDAYWRHVFSPNFRISGRARAIMREAILGFELFPPDTTVAFELDAEPEREYRLVDIKRNLIANLVTADTGSSEAEFDLLPTGIYPASMVIAQGRAFLKVRNLCKRPAGIVLIREDDRVDAVLAEEPPQMEPFLTGKQLLNHQSFRDLFRVQQLIPGLQLPLRSLTILFTDLKGSTALYDRTGDAYAYGLVQEHYQQLAEAVRENSGAVIKTMGDAIMASFSHPLDAMRAAIDMVDRIETLNTQWSRDGNELGLKVGLHEGPALAVNADDRLDYFGQTVNIAARVQGLAEAGEIWHTAKVLEAAGVEDLLRSRGFEESSHSVSLKGVGEVVLVHQWRSAEQSV